MVKLSINRQQYVSLVKAEQTWVTKRDISKMEEAERFSYFLHWYSNQYSRDIEMWRISAEMLGYNIIKLIWE